MEFGSSEYDLDRCRDLLEEERFEEAFELAAELRERAPLDSEVVALLCDAALGSGRPAEALRAANAYLRGGVTTVEVLEWRVRAQWDLHLSEQCRQTCRRILRRDPRNVTAIDYGLSTLLELGDFAEAGDFIELARSLPGASSNLRLQANVARMMRGDDEGEVAEEFERFRRAAPYDPIPYVNLMRIHLGAGRTEEVEKLFDAATAFRVEHEDIEFHMGMALKSAERMREAARRFAAAARLNADLPDAHLYLGQILREQGHPLLALSMLQRELRADDTHPAVHAEMAWCAEDLGRFDDAVRMIRAATERAPQWGLYQHSLAELLLKEDPDSEEAAGVAARAVELDDSHAAGWQVLGRLSAEDGDLERAETCLRNAVGARDATVEDEGWLGLLLAEVNRADDASPLLERALRVFPTWDPLGDALGRIRGHPLPVRYEFWMAGREPSGEKWYRIVHVVATDEAGARSTAVEESACGEGEIREMRVAGFEVDHDPGVVWDSGLTRDGFAQPPLLYEEPEDS